jgi:hypothetical protein
MPARRYALLIAALPLAAHAAHNMKPGLWEASDKIAGNGTSPLLEHQLRQIAGMSPARRKQMQQLLASQGLTIRKDGVTQKVCVTPEMAAEMPLPIQQQGGCDYRFAPKVNGAIRYWFSCAHPPASGSGSITFSGTTSYSGGMHGISSASGSPVAEHIASSGRWLSASCGRLAPNHDF